MSFDQRFLAELVGALAQAKLETILIGNAAAILHGAPVFTHKVELLVREHPNLEAKLKRFAEIFDVKMTTPYRPSSRMIRCTGRPVEIDFLLSLFCGEPFEVFRFRSSQIRIGTRRLRFASLEDVIEEMEHAGRRTELAMLGMLKDTLRVRNEMRQPRYQNSMEY